MTREDAARLTRGQEVMIFERGELEGRAAMVVHATDRGGVKVCVNGEEVWYPYHRVCGGG